MNISDTDIAVIGMAIRFPGATNTWEFWQNLRNGVESTKEIPKEDLIKAGRSEEIINSSSLVRREAVLDEISTFDNEFFDYLPAEAQTMDPQHRKFMECAWECLERAAKVPDKTEDRVGVFAGCSISSYFISNILPAINHNDPVSLFQALIANDKDYLVTRTSYKLNLRGPSIAINTACSTSLVAIHMACQSLLNGECEMALAGGVRIMVPHRSGYIYQEGGVNSPDGHCRAFDEKANGTASGNGVGVVLLKPLREALEDGDIIHAVIKGTAINNDGADKVGFTAPSVSGQSEVINEALNAAKISPDTIEVIEAHGTGTSLGDPIEIAALTNAYSQYTDRTNYCAIGSLKTNIGHMDAAAGVGGFIKAVLSLKHKEIFPSLNYDSPNKQIPFSKTPFYVNKKLSSWKTNGQNLRRAAVSSFGIGGTNAHAILEEAPNCSKTKKVENNHTYEIVGLSAKSPNLTIEQANNLKVHLSRHEINLKDIVYTLIHGRKKMYYRSAIVAKNTSELINNIQRDQHIVHGFSSNNNTDIAFMFPGQGIQYSGMAKDLYLNNAEFRKYFEQCNELASHHDLDLLTYITGASDYLDSELQKCQISQPLLFAVEFALAKTLITIGLKPSAMIGHSVGEYVAACLAGVFNLKDAIYLVCQRGHCIQKYGLNSSMLAVDTPASTIKPLLPIEINIAAINEPDSCVISGDYQTLKDFNVLLKKQGHNTVELKASHGFHSLSVVKSAEYFRSILSKVTLHEPKLKIISNYTGNFVRNEEVTNIDYWVNHMLETVNFKAGIQTLLEKSCTVFIEIGPEQSLINFVRKTRNKLFDGSEVTCLSCLPHAKDKTTSDLFFKLTQARAWCLGYISLSAKNGRMVELPGYPFQKNKHWISAKSTNHAETTQTNTDDKEPEIGVEGIIINIWEELLAIEKVLPEDNYFSLGGDSLQASRIVASINNHFGITITTKEFFDQETLRALSNSVKQELSHLQTQQIKNNNDNE